MKKTTVLMAVIIALSWVVMGWTDTLPSGNSQPYLDPGWGEHDCSTNYHPSRDNEHDSATSVVYCDSDPVAGGSANCSASRVNVWITSVVCSGGICSGQGGFKCGTRSVSYNVTGCMRHMQIHAGMSGFECADSDGNAKYCLCVWQANSWTVQGNSCN